MEPVYGIVNKNNQWMTDGNGKIVAFEHKRVAMAQAQMYNASQSGVPYTAKEIGEDGLPVDESEEYTVNPTNKAAVKEKKK